MTDVFTIRDLENLSGIKAHTIRIWEQRYSFLKPGRTETNIRYYSSNELKTILNISLLTKYGYKISHIDKMSGEEMGSRIRGLRDKEAVEERQVNDLIANMVDLDIDAFEKLLDECILVRGIDKALHRIVFPFLHRIGILWAARRVNPAQEHLVTNIIRQKLIVGIEATLTQRHAGRTILLFLPEGERRELGLLYMHYLLKAHGVSVFYLGADVPLADLEFVCRQKNPDFLYTHLTAAGSYNLERFLALVSQRLSGTPLVISGQPARAQTRKLPPGVHIRRSMAEVMEFISSL